MRFVFGVVFAALFLVCSSSKADIIETPHIKNVIPLIDQDTWFLVDLDNCMFESKQAVGHASWFYDLVQESMQEGLTREEAICHVYPRWIETQQYCEVQPLEEEFIPILLNLQARGITIIGLTHRQPSVADSTIRQVASLGFDFSKTAPPSPSNLTNLSTSPTLYSQGIVFVSDYNQKIDIFRSFLSALNQKPRKVVFIDDKLKNVAELEALASQDIEYHGVHYTAIQHVKPVYIREIGE